MKLSQRLVVRFLNLAKISGIKDGRSPSQFMFDANHFHTEATLEAADSDKLSKHSSYFLQEGYIQSKVGSHIMTGIP